MSNFLTPQQQASHENTPPQRLRELALKSIELARVVAKNPSAPPDLLEVLSDYHDDIETRKNVTANPNTPIKQLFTLGACFPLELLNNPVFPLLILENPCLFQEMPVATATSLLRLDEIPEEYLVMAAESNSDKATSARRQLKL